MNSPCVGLIVDYYSSPSERNAALVTNFKTEGEDFTTQPRCDLQIFLPNGKIIFEKDVPYVDKDASAGDQPAEIAQRWAFAHEFPVEQEAGHDPDTEQGINSNALVGQLNNQYE